MLQDMFSVYTETINIVFTVHILFQQCINQLPFICAYRLKQVHVLSVGRSIQCLQ